ncbi:TetR/AcrR family transcriptional regulator [Methyloferula stellata]|uniref:TetR/AcrR family transcriptional regulator n=1 Tax=Methyloferula stellata TaxID=876270 RepID=UPI0003A2225A|nr:TetR/AcrR family transcriptional regulator [Methyloferula stellata]
MAQRIFLERGYSQTTMQSIAEEAGASKETLYRHFGSKEGLFTEIVRAKSAQIATRLDEEITLHASPDEVLTHVGTSLLKTLSCDDVLSFYGWIVAETPRAPELGRIFYELGPAMVRAKLKTYLERATEQKVLCCDNPILATKIFLGSILADIHLRALTLGVKDIGEAEIREQVDAAVAMFLARYRYPVKA